MVNSEVVDSPGDGNAKEYITQLNSVSTDSHSPSPVTAASLCLREMDFANETADITTTECGSPMDAPPETAVTGEENSRLTADSESVEVSSLYCSVPLNKVQDVLNSYRNNSNNEMFDANDSGEFKSKKLSRKLLCLYCERTFVTINLRQKHVDRCHSEKQARRSSSRFQQSQSTTACIFCNKLNSTDHSLNELFKHLVDEHSNKYFACEHCEERFLFKSHLEEHNLEVHNINSIETLDLSDDKLKDCESTEEEKLKINGAIFPQLVTNNTESNESQDREKTKIIKSKHKPKIKKELHLNESLKQRTSTAISSRRPNLRMSVRKELRKKKVCVKSTKLGVKRNTRLQARITQTKPIKKRPKTNKTAEKPVSVKPEVNEKSSTCINPYPTFDAFFRVKKITDHSIDNLKISSLTFDDVFDKAFYNRIKCNIQENLQNHIDGKLFKNEESESRISNFEKLREVGTSPTENFGCDISLNAATPVVSLLSTQFGEDLESQIEYGSKASKKKPPPKQDEVHYKYFTRRKYQASILESKENRDLSKLDMWTQLVVKNRQQKIINDKKTDKEMLEYTKGNEYRTKVQNEELNRILDRRGPFEDLKEEANKKAALEKLNRLGEHINCEAISDVTCILNDIFDSIFDRDNESIKEEEINIVDVEEVNDSKLHNFDPNRDCEIPFYLNLRPSSSLAGEPDVDKSDRITLICSSQETEDFEQSTVPRDKNTLVELTGEWTRSRIYICAACGVKVSSMKLLIEHKSIFHQNVWVQHYEFVGNQSELYRHLSIPTLGKVGHVEDFPLGKFWRRSEARFCTKCSKTCNSLSELHRHVLECGEDWSWMLARRKLKYRPFGAKSRRKRRGLVKRIIHKDKPGDEVREKKKYNIKRIEGPRPKPSDAETIQRMLANLPAKRATRKIISLKDGFQRPLKKQPQKLNNVKDNQSKSQTGKLVTKNKSVKNTREQILKANHSNRGMKCNPIVLRKSVRNINKVFGTKLLDTNSTLLVKRKIKTVLQHHRMTRSRRQKAKSETKSEKLETQTQTKQKVQAKVKVFQKTLTRDVRSKKTDTNTVNETKRDSKNANSKTKTFTLRKARSFQNLLKKESDSSEVTIISKNNESENEYVDIENVDETQSNTESTNEGIPDRKTYPVRKTGRLRNIIRKYNSESVEHQHKKECVNSESKESQPNVKPIEEINDESCSKEVDKLCNGKIENNIITDMKDSVESKRKLKKKDSIRTKLVRSLSLRKLRKNNTENDGLRTRSNPDLSYKKGDSGNEKVSNGKRKSALNSIKKVMKKMKLRNKSITNIVQIDGSSQISDEIPKILPFFENIHLNEDDLSEENDSNSENKKTSDNFVNDSIVQHSIIKNSVTNHVIDDKIIKNQDINFDISCTFNFKSESRNIQDVNVPELQDQCKDKTKEMQQGVCHLSQQNPSNVNDLTHNSIDKLESHNNNNQMDVESQKINSDTKYKGVQEISKSKPKKRVKGLNDCIAMLTSKLQQKVEEKDISQEIPLTKVDEVQKCVKGNGANIHIQNNCENKLNDEGIANNLHTSKAVISPATFNFQETIRSDDLWEKRHENIDVGKKISNFYENGDNISEAALNLHGTKVNNVHEVLNKYSKNVLEINSLKMIESVHLAHAMYEKSRLWTDSNGLKEIKDNPMPLANCKFKNDYVDMNHVTKKEEAEVLLKLDQTTTENDKLANLMSNIDSLQDINITNKFKEVDVNIEIDIMKCLEKVTDNNLNNHREKPRLTKKRTKTEVRKKHNHKIGSARKFKNKRKENIEVITCDNMDVPIPEIEGVKLTCENDCSDDLNTAFIEANDRLQELETPKNSEKKIITEGKRKIGQRRKLPLNRATTNPNDVKIKDDGSEKIVEHPIILKINSLPFNEPTVHNEKSEIEQNDKITINDTMLVSVTEKPIKKRGRKKKLQTNFSKLNNELGCKLQASLAPEQEPDILEDKTLSNNFIIGNINCTLVNKTSSQPGFTDPITKSTDNSITNPSCSDKDLDVLPQDILNNTRKHETDSEDEIPLASLIKNNESKQEYQNSESLSINKPVIEETIVENVKQSDIYIKNFNETCSEPCIQANEEILKESTEISKKRIGRKKKSNTHSKIGFIKNMIQIDNQDLHNSETEDLLLSHEEIECRPMTESKLKISKSIFQRRNKDKILFNKKSHTHKGKTKPIEKKNKFLKPNIKIKVKKKKIMTNQNQENIFIANNGNSEDLEEHNEKSPLEDLEMEIRRKIRLSNLLLQMENGDVQQDEIEIQETITDNVDKVKINETLEIQETITDKVDKVKINETLEIQETITDKVDKVKINETLEIQETLADKVDKVKINKTLVDKMETEVTVIDNIVKKRKIKKCKKKYQDYEGIVKSDIPNKSLLRRKPRKKLKICNKTVPLNINSEVPTNIIKTTDNDEYKTVDNIGTTIKVLKIYKTWKENEQLFDNSLNDISEPQEENYEPDSVNSSFHIENKQADNIEIPEIENQKSKEEISTPAKDTAVILEPNELTQVDIEMDREKDHLNEDVVREKEDHPNDKDVDREKEDHPNDEDVDREKDHPNDEDVEEYKCEDIIPEEFEFENKIVETKLIYTADQVCAIQKENVQAISQNYYHLSVENEHNREIDINGSPALNKNESETNAETHEIESKFIKEKIETIDGREVHSANKTQIGKFMSEFEIQNKLLQQNGLKNDLLTGNAFKQEVKMPKKRGRKPKSKVLDINTDSTQCLSDTSIKTDTSTFGFNSIQEQLKRKRGRKKKNVNQLNTDIDSNTPVSSQCSSLDVEKNGDKNSISSIQENCLNNISNELDLSVIDVSQSVPVSFDSSCNITDPSENCDEAKDTDTSLTTLVVLNNSTQEMKKRRGRKPKNINLVIESVSNTSDTLDKTQTSDQNYSDIFASENYMYDKSIELQTDSFIKSPDLNDTMLACKIKSQFNVKVGSKKVDKNKKFNIIPDSTEELFCDICNKLFVRYENLIKHKRTLTHIAKLSEIEAKEAAEKTKFNEVEVIENAESFKMNINISDILSSGEKESECDLNNEITNKLHIHSPFMLNTNSNNLKLADIINDVLNKPVPHENIKHNSYNDTVIPAPISDMIQKEPKRYKSLGERKSFESDLNTNYTFNNLPLANDLVPPKLSNNTNSILNHQLSILENIIDNQGSFAYIDDISISSNKSIEQFSRESSELSVMSDTKQDDSNQIEFSDNTNIINSLIKPGLHTDNFIKPTQYEEISNDSSTVRNHFDEQRSRKALNRDEELFLECCSLLKSSSEISSYSKRSSKTISVLNNCEIKPSDEPDYLEKKTFTAVHQGLRNESFSDSCPNTPLGDGYGDDYSNTNSNTIGTDWNTKQKEQQILNKNPAFEDISLDNREIGDPDPEGITLGKKDSVEDNANDNQSDEVQNNKTSFSDFKIFGTEQCAAERDNFEAELENDNSENSDNHVNVDNDLKKKMVSRFGGLMVKAFKNSLQMVKKPKQIKKKTTDNSQTSIIDYAVPLNLNKNESECNDSKKMLTKGAMKVFEGLKVSIPTDDLDINELLNGAFGGKNLEQENTQQESTDVIKKDETNETRDGDGPTRKMSIKKFGNKLGLKITKKKHMSKIKKSPLSKNKKLDEDDESKKIHDIYDFEETQDNTDVFNPNITNLRTFRNQVTEKKTNEPEPSTDKESDFAQPENIVESDSESNNRVLEAFSFEAQSMSSFSAESIASVKKPKQQNITKKKCMIMGRIFKNAFKSKIEDDIRDIPTVDNSKLVQDYVMHLPNDNKISKQNKLSEKEMDYLFDKLVKEEEQAVIKETVIENKTADVKLKTDEKSVKTKLKVSVRKKRQRQNSESTDDEFSINKTKKRTTKKKLKNVDNGINLEQELKECIGVASRKSQRKCTSGKQNVLVEFWSSDESNFEALFTEAIGDKAEELEKLPVTNEEIETALVLENQVTEPVEEPEAIPPEICPTEIKVDKEKQKVIKGDKVGGVKQVRRKSIAKHNRVKDDEEKEDKKLKNIKVTAETLAANRRKRAAADTLYYWSSSSEDESQDLIEVKPLRDEDDEDDDRLVQHGWIVGNSPKKLVTMLAQAKGKKVDAESVKEQGKKRTTL